MSNKIFPDGNNQNQNYQQPQNMQNQGQYQQVPNMQQGYGQQQMMQPGQQQMMQPGQQQMMQPGQQQMMQPGQQQMMMQPGQQQMMMQPGQQQMMMQPGQQQMMMQPGQQMMMPGMMPGQQIVFAPIIVDPLDMIGDFDKLEKVPGVFVKQKFDLFEALSGCERENKYTVFVADEKGEKTKKELFKIKEKSSFCARYLLPGSCRPFESKFTNKANDNVFMKTDRKCACTYLCLNRPEMEVYNVDNGKDDFIGKIVNPFQFFDAKLNVFDKANKHIFTITGNCCQLGFWFKFPCESCQTIDFEVADEKGEILSRLQKRSKGCLKAAISDADDFSLIFPKKSTKEERALLLAAVIFLDFQYFEENPENQNQNGHVHVSF